jgi:hypothetical protein
MTMRIRCLEAMLCFGLTCGISAAQTPPPAVDKAVKTGQEVAKAGKEMSKAGQDAAKKIQSASNAKPTTIVATVEAIDQANRTVMLKGPQGNVAEVYVDETHKGFDTLKVGDSIKATYYESVVVQVRKEGEPAPTTGDKSAITPRPGGGGTTVARQVIATVTIKAIDPAVPSVTVEDPKGRVFSMRVQDPKRLDGVKAGDTVDVTYTQALLLSLGK